MAGGLERKPGGGSLVEAALGGGASSAATGVGKQTLTGQLDAHGPMRVTTSGLNVRNSPSKDSRDNIIGLLHRHAPVEADGRHGDWVKIAYRGKPGFVFGHYVAPAPKAKAGAGVEPVEDAPAPVETPDPAHVSPPAPDPAAKHDDPAKAKAPPKLDPTADKTPDPPAAPRDGNAATTGSGQPPPPLDHMAQFVYDVRAGSATQKALVFVAGGQLTLTPDVFVFFHGQRADYGIDAKQLRDRKASEHARIEKEQADPTKDPKKIHGDETAGYVESGRKAAEEAMRHAEGKNVISILPQGVMGSGGSAGGHMATLTAKGGGLPAFIESVMVSLQKDLHGDKLAPGRISIAGHSAGGFMGVAEALGNAGGLEDTITDITLMDAEYEGAQFARASHWLLQGKPGKSFRIVAQTAQLKTGRHSKYFDHDNLKANAEAKGFTVVNKGGAGQPRGPKTVVVYHAHVMHGAEVHADVLILNTAMGHHEVRDNVMDDSILNIGQGARGGGESYGTAVHGVAPAEAGVASTTGTTSKTSTAPTSATPTSDAPAQAAKPAATEAAKPAAAADTDAGDHETDAAEAPQHNPDPTAPEKPRAAPTRIKVPSNSASKSIYAPGGVLNESHLTRGKGNKLDDDELAFKHKVYLAATGAKMTQKIFGGLADDELGDITGILTTKPMKFRKILMPALHDLFRAMDKDIQAGTRVKGIAPTDVKGVGITSGYRGPEHEMHLWDTYFQQYLAATTKRRVATGEPFGDKAIQIMVDYIGRRKAAPGHSNHSNGTAVDVWALSKTHKIPNEFGNQQPWLDSWHYAWLQENAAAHQFRNYKAEAWHWEYIT